jgi:UPF0148 protein
MVMGLKEEEMLERMTRLLEQGCTMLATHHSCGAPLFRCKGRVVCPVCSLEGQAKPETRELREGALGEELAQPKKPVEEEVSALEMMESEAQPEAEERRRRKKELEDALSTILLRRLRELEQRADQEEDLEDLRRVLECMYSLLKVLRSLERYN